MNETPKTDERSENAPQPAGPAAALPVAPVSPLAPKKPAKLPETTEGMPWMSNHEVKKEPSPFKDGDGYSLVYAWAGMLVRLVIIFGSIFTVVQFLAAREEKRVERTFALVDVWEGQGIQTALTAINDRLAELNEQNQKLLPASPSEKELSAYMSRIGIAAMQPDPARPDTAAMPQHFDTMLYFLGRVAFCVDRDLCSDDVADSYFKDYAISFWSYFSGYVEQRRARGAATYGEPVEAYVKSHTAAAATP